MNASVKCTTVIQESKHKVRGLKLRKKLVNTRMRHKLHGSNINSTYGGLGFIFPQDL